MASDFGDESGEKLFDWFLRMGQDMSEEALRASAERLKGAIQNLRGNLEDAAPQQDASSRASTCPSSRSSPTTRA